MRNIPLRPFKLNLRRLPARSQFSAAQKGAGRNKEEVMFLANTHVKHLGYAISRRIRLYGEEFEVVSDPFPEADGIAVHVTTKKDSSIRILRIPATVLQSAKGRRLR
jgi:hypothetical protein